jgi:hypothetical protein
MSERDLRSLCSDASVNLILSKPITEEKIDALISQLQSHAKKNADTFKSASLKRNEKALSGNGTKTSRRKSTGKIKSTLSQNTTPKRSEKVVSAEDPASFPVVGVGPSAGGLAAVTDLLKHLPPGIGAAFVTNAMFSPLAIMRVANVWRVFCGLRGVMPRSSWAFLHFFEKFEWSTCPPAEFVNRNWDDFPMTGTQPVSLTSCSKASTECSCPISNRCDPA